MKTYISLTILVALLASGCGGAGTSTTQPVGTFEGVAGGSGDTVLLNVDPTGSLLLTLFNRADGIFYSGPNNEIAGNAFSVQCENVKGSQITVKGNLSTQGATGSISGALNEPFTAPLKAQPGANVFAGTYEGSGSSSASTTEINWSGRVSPGGAFIAQGKTAAGQRVAMRGIVSPVGAVTMTCTFNDANGLNEETWAGWLFITTSGAVQGVGRWDSTLDDSGTWKAVRLP